MSDPLGPIHRISDVLRDIPQPDRETEILRRQDPEESAVRLIRDLELRLWFAADDRLAARIDRRCPACSVFTIPSGAMLVNELRLPPRWRRRP